MSAKNLDTHNRWRNKTVAFRVSPEENEQIDAAVRLSGLTKQDYITKRLLCRDVVVQGNPRVYKALRDELATVLAELWRIRDGANVDSELLDTIRMIAAIIDTLQKIREAGGDKYSYANDYEVVGKLKRLADDCGVCLLLVHHTRKQQADDKFDMISGTNGLLGAADGAFLLQKEKRTDGSAVLDVAGRDQQDQRFYLTKDKERLIWTLERTETEAWTEPPDPVLEAIAALVTVEKPTWGGTATELVAALQTDMKPNALAMRLNVRAGKLLTDYHIRYENSRSHAGRSISLTLEPSQA